MSDNFLQLVCLLSDSVLPFFSCSVLVTSPKTYGCHRTLNSPLCLLFHGSSDDMPIPWPCLGGATGAAGTVLPSAHAVNMGNYEVGKCNFTSHTADHTASQTQLVSGLPVMGYNVLVKPVESYFFKWQPRALIHLGRVGQAFESAQPSICDVTLPGSLYEQPIQHTPVSYN